MSFTLAQTNDLLNEYITHDRVDAGPFDVEGLLRVAVGWDDKQGPRYLPDGWPTGYHYAHLHIGEALIQLRYAQLALENR